MSFRKLGEAGEDIYIYVFEQTHTPRCRCRGGHYPTSAIWPAKKSKYPPSLPMPEPGFRPRYVDKQTFDVTSERRENPSLEGTIKSFRNVALFFSVNLI